MILSVGFQLSEYPSRSLQRTATSTISIPRGEEMKRQSISVIVVLSLLIAFTASIAQAADRYSVATGNWGSTRPWSATSGGSSGASVPVAGDNVYIERTYTVTIAANAACATITIGTANGAGTLTFRSAGSASYTLTVSGNISIARQWFFYSYK